MAYFSNLCDDYRNTDEVMPDEIIAEYDRLTPFFEKNPAAAEYKSQFDAAFGLSGAASCENLERLFKGKLAAAPDDSEWCEVVEIDLTRSENVRRWWPFLRDRRIDSYNDILRRFID